MEMKLRNPSQILNAAEILAIDVLYVDERTEAFTQLLLALPPGYPRPCENDYPHLNVLLDRLTTQAQ